MCLLKKALQNEDNLTIDVLQETKQCIQV